MMSAVRISVPAAGMRTRVHFPPKIERQPVPLIFERNPHTCWLGLRKMARGHIVVRSSVMVHIVLAALSMSCGNDVLPPENAPNRVWARMAGAAKSPSEALFREFASSPPVAYLAADTTTPQPIRSTVDNNKRRRRRRRSI